jgi:hypothetical protein
MTMMMDTLISTSTRRYENEEKSINANVRQSRNVGEDVVIGKKRRRMMMMMENNGNGG